MNFLLNEEKEKEDTIKTLKLWLINSLEPICDADPNVLADYILALLQKETNSLVDLKNLCQSQLEDFLGNETSNFITRLFSINLLTNINNNNNNNNNNNSFPTPPTLSSSFQYPITRDNQNSFNSNNNHDKNNNSNCNGNNAVSVELCKDYHYKGFCARGDWCSFAHDDPIIRPPFNAPNSQTQFFPNSPSSTRPCSIASTSSSSASTSQISIDRVNSSDSRDQLAKTLIVENVPLEALNSTVVYNFFETFGPIRDVQVDSARRKVLVTFNSSEHAKVALSSPAAIFGNRFVRIYRQKSPFPSSSISNFPLIATLPRYYMHSLSSIPTSTVSSQPSNFQTAPNVVPQTWSSNRTIRMRRAISLQRNAQEQKYLLTQLENVPSLPLVERRVVLDHLRKLGAEATQLTQLDIMADSRATLAQLQAEAISLGIDTHPRNRSHQAIPTQVAGKFQGGGGGVNKTSRIHPYQIGTNARTYRLDNRSTKVVVGFLSSEDSLPELMKHFESFGEIKKISVSTTSSSSSEYILEYTLRSSAEEAMRGGTWIESIGEISLQWETRRSNSAPLPVDEIKEKEAAKSLPVVEPREEEKSWR